MAGLGAVRVAQIVGLTSRTRAGLFPLYALGRVVVYKVNITVQTLTSLCRTSRLARPLGRLRPPLAPSVFPFLGADGGRHKFPHGPLFGTFRRPHTGVLSLPYGPFRFPCPSACRACHFVLLAVGSP